MNSIDTVSADCLSECLSECRCASLDGDADCLSECLSECRCASLDGDADRLVYFKQQDATFHLFDGDKIAVLAALLVRDILNDLHLPAESIKVSMSCLSFPSSLWSRLTLCMALPNSQSLAKPEAILSTLTVSCWMPLLSCNDFRWPRFCLYLVHISPHA